MGLGHTKISRGPRLGRHDLPRGLPEPRSTTSKLAYAIGSSLLWLLTASGIAWWIFTALRVYEAQWAALACAVVPIPILFAAYVLQRIWTWLWVSWNTKKTVARRLTSRSAITTDHD